MSDDEKDTLKPLIEAVVPGDKYTIQMEAMDSGNLPFVITQPEFMRRMMEQQRMGGGGMFGAFPEMHHLVVNANHPKVSALLEKKEKDQKQAVKQLTDLALLSQGLLKGEALNDFVERNIEQIS